MTTERPELSIIIPAYNEEKRITATLIAIQDYMEKVPYQWEVLVVDDGSRDQTVKVARAAMRDDRCRVVKNPRNMGKGASIRNGMMAAKGRLRLFTDADNSTPIEEVAKLLKAMEKRNADVAIASRAVAGSKLEKRQPIYRELMGRTFNLIVQLVALPGIKDTQCGFKLFTDRAAREIFPLQKMKGFSFDVELLMLARRLGFRVVEVPVRWIDSPTSRVSPIKDSAKMFLDVVWLRWRLRNFKPKKVRNS